MINDNKVMIFSKSFCPDCKALKQSLDEKGIQYKAFEVDLEEDGEGMHDALKDLSNCETVPNTYIKGEHFGGCEDTMNALKSGELYERIGICRKYEEVEVDEV